jgi:hypothetical protein
VAGGILLVTLIVLPALRDWRAQQTYVSPAELEEVTQAGRIAATTPPGTALVFTTDSPDTQEALFRRSHLLNVARAGVPPERAADVATFLGRPQDLLAHAPSNRAEPAYDAASADSLAQLPPGPRVVFVIGALNDEAALDAPGLTRWSTGLASTAADPRPLPAIAGELRASDPRRSRARRPGRSRRARSANWAGPADDGDGPGASHRARLRRRHLTLAALGLERRSDLERGSVAVLACVVAGGTGYALLVARLVARRHVGSARRSSSNSDPRRMRERKVEHHDQHEPDERGDNGQCTGLRALSAKPPG